MFIPAKNNGIDIIDHISITIDIGILDIIM